MSVDPYQTPESMPIEGLNRQFSDRYGPVRDLSSLAKFSEVMLIVNITISLGHAIYWISGMVLGEGFFNSEEFITLYGFLDTVVIILSAIAICMWTSKAMANTWSLAKIKPTITPGWAAGWYFIPFAFWWKPYEAMMEIWNGTFDFKRSKWMLRIWWLLWIGLFLIDVVGFQSGDEVLVDGSDSEYYVVMGLNDGMTFISNIVNMLCAGCLIKIIGAVTRAHQMKLESSS